MGIRKHTIFRKILVPLTLIMALQLFIIYGAIYLGGTVKEMQNNSLDILQERTQSRANLLETEMVQRWSRLESTAQAIVTQAEETMLENSLAPASSFKLHSEESTVLLNEISDEIITMIRRSTVTGGFFILAGDDENVKDGVYFRDINPQNDPADYSDVLALCGPSSVTKKLGIALNAYWRSSFDLTRYGEEGASFYTNPVKAALEHPNFKITDCGYWSSFFHVNSEKYDVPVITYSIPLRLSDGTLLGVLGVEIDYDYLSQLIPSRDLGQSGREGYLLLKEKGNEWNRVEAVTGSFFKSKLQSGQTVNFETDSFNDRHIYLKSDNIAKDVLSYQVGINLYNTNTPFVEERWVVAAVADKDVLFDAANRFEERLFYCALGAALLGFIGIFLSARLVANPISGLSSKLKNTSARQAVSLGKIGVAEIDELITSLEYYSGRAADSAARLSQILEMTGITVGAFSIDGDDSETVQCTSGVFELLPWLGQHVNESGEVPFEIFSSNRLKDFISGNAEDTVVSTDVEIDSENGEKRWLRAQIKRTGGKILGVFTDVTQEVFERKRIEHDRDYDVLTNLYNRRAFWYNVNIIGENPKAMKVSAALMIDLDNLKFVNDTYGHDYGDLYIRTTGSVLGQSANERCIASRISGDEFVLFFHGFDSKQEIYELCNSLQNTMRETMITVPDGTLIQLRASAGLAWYPDDSKNLEQLVHYADFAMYMVKRDRKGELSEFNLEIYNQNAYLLHCMEELNTLIEQEMIDYQFQPIIDVHTGEIFAYEALMRPRSENIKSPLELIALAKSQFKLASLERLTFFRATESFAEQPVAYGTAKLFVNSLANQIMTDDEISEFQERFKPFLSRIVVEVTESEQNHEDYTGRKLQICKEWGAEIAVDDYGTGYNGEVSILSLSPKYVKIDISLVRDIDTNLDKQQIVSNLVLYAHDRGIKLIAEGIESRSELEKLISMGVDLAQGYYLARPSFGAISSLSDEKLEELAEINQKAECIV